MKPLEPSEENPVQMQLANLAHASVLQLRDAIRRATATHVPADGRSEHAFLAGVEVTDSTWGEWEDTAFDVRRDHA